MSPNTDRRAREASAERQPYSIILPVYNEAENFPALMDEVERLLKQPFTMYVVYDFEEDTTLPVARRLAEIRPWLRLVRNDVGAGVVNALKAGFQSVESGPALVMMADLSDDLSVVEDMLRLYHEGARIVCASRYMKGGAQIGGPLVKRTMSRTAGLLLRFLVKFPTHDPTNNFRLYDAKLVEELGIESNGGFEVALELTAKAFRRGVPIAEVPSTWRDRTAGESRFRLLHWLPQYLRWYLHALFGRRPL